jgi:membrane associated rhomboid family serine protease
VRIIAAILAVLWLVGVIDWLAFGGRLETFGIVPRTSRGLLGILFAPFLHIGFSHLLANTVAFLLFGGLVLFRQERDFWIVTGIGALFSGVGTWLVGHTGVHVGASGVIFAYFGYLLLTGWFERRIPSLILSILVFLVWWRTLFGLMPTQQGISWEGHLFGLFGGMLAARLLSRRGRVTGAA